MATILDSIVLPFSECLTPAAARRIVAMRADAALQARVDDLATKANTGELNEDERQEYDRYLAAYHFVTLMQLRAKQMLGT